MLFLSIWGRDGVMQHFFASLTLPLAEGGLRVMTVTKPDGDKLVLDLSNAKSLSKRTTRLPKYTEVGEWVHTWLFHPGLPKPDATESDTADVAGFMANHQESVPFAAAE